MISASVALSPAQAVPGHRVRQRRGPHVPHAETEEASGGACQVGAGQAGRGPSSGGRQPSVGGTRTPLRRHLGESSEPQSPALLLRWQRGAQLFLPLGHRPGCPVPPGPARPGGISLHSPALSCFPQFSLFLISSLGKNSVQLHESPEILLGRRQVINQEARTPRSQSRALLLAVMKSTTRARRVGRRDSAALSTLAGSCSRRHPVCRTFHLP